MGITSESQVKVNMAAGLFDGTIPGGSTIRGAVGLDGGVDESSKEYRGTALAASIAGFALPFPGGGSAKVSEEVLGLKKLLASEGQFAELMNGGGHAIAGAGVAREIDDLPRLLNTYGGEAADWAKISSSGYKAEDGISFQIHAYKNIKTGEIFEMKTKLSSLKVGP